jgi:hypothetical protein
MNSKLLVISATAALCLATATARADYDVAADFSASINPNGVWTYGWTQNLGGAFVVNTIRGTASGLDVWTGSVVSPLGTWPAIVHNGTNQSVTLSNTVTYAPGQFGMHSGPGGEYAVVRFTAPISGGYLLTSRFSGLDFVGPTTTDVHVLLNNSAVFSAAVNSFGAGPSYSPSSVFSLQAGDTIDFAVGFGANGNYFFDSTGLSARISAIPEPATLLQFAAGVLFLLALAQNRTAPLRRSAA